MAFFNKVKKKFGTKIADQCKELQYKLSKLKLNFFKFSYHKYFKLRNVSTLTGFRILLPMSATNDFQLLVGLVQIADDLREVVVVHILGQEEEEEAIWKRH